MLLSPVRSLCLKSHLTSSTSTPLFRPSRYGSIVTQLTNPTLSCLFNSTGVMTIRFFSTSMNRLLRFDGRVVVVTGAGGGLGKAYALLFAERGASVVVNDLGGNQHGDGSSSRAADQVVDEIVKKGGKAVPNYDSVTEGDNIIKTAIDKFGRIDILVNNAGILRDRSFIKMTQSDWDLVNQVHLLGAFKTTKAAWDHFKKQEYGRIINTSSVAGLLGNFGQANYSAAKAGLYGFSSTLAKEGARFNIHTNVIVPMAGSRLTENILPPELHAALKPELIAPVVAWMCHENCLDNGVVIEAAGGFAARYKFFRSKGAVLRTSIDEELTIEDVKCKWDKILDMKDDPDSPDSAEEGMGKFMDALRAQSGSALAKATRLNLSEMSFPEVKYKYDTNAAILYALGLGASTTDPYALNFLYENAEDFRVLPTFPVVPALPCMFEVMKTPSLEVDFTRILHGEQFIELYRPLPQEGEVVLKTKVVEVMDKISGAVYVLKVTGEDDKGPLFSTEWSVFEVGAGKFGGKRDTEKFISRPVNPPKRAPDTVLEYTTSERQGALYRLSGDNNPLHIDPNFAKMGGFSKPILHGLCTFGIAARLILQEYADSDPKNFKAIKARFAKPVYPGQTLQVPTWRDGNRIHFEVKVKETDTSVVTGAYVDLHHVKSKL